jgi:hypothetical protein
MPPTDDSNDLGQKLTQAEAVIAELRGVVAEVRKQVEAQQAHIHRLVKMTFGCGGERVLGPTLFDAMAVSESEVPTTVEMPRSRPPSARIALNRSDAVQTAQEVLSASAVWTLTIQGPVCVRPGWAAISRAWHVGHARRNSPAPNLGESPPAQQLRGSSPRRR